MTSCVGGGASFSFTAPVGVAACFWRVLAALTRVANLSTREPTRLASASISTALRTSTAGSEGACGLDAGVLEGWFLASKSTRSLGRRMVSS